MENILAPSKKPLIAVHRGKSGGNIIENSVASARCAVMSGGDIVEFDVARSRDGEIFVFHTGMELQLFKSPIPLCLRSASSIKRRSLFNDYFGNSGCKLQTLDEYLDGTKGLCLLNLDRIWKADPKKTLEKVKAHGMLGQIILKTCVSKRDEALMELAAKYLEIFFMGIVRNREQLDTLESLCKKYSLTLRGVEVIFSREDDYFASPEFFDRCKKMGWLVWVNAITLNGRPDMCACHGDDVSIRQSPDKGWEWLLDRPYDIIQTDWPSLLKDCIARRSSK